MPKKAKLSFEPTTLGELVDFIRTNSYEGVCMAYKVSDTGLTDYEVIALSDLEAAVTKYGKDFIPDKFRNLREQENQKK